MNKSLVFVIGQFVFGIFLIATTIYSKINLSSGFFILIGLAIVLSATIFMRRSVIKVFPDVDNRAILVENGPYKWVRHPMYSGVLTAGFGLFLTQITLIRFLAYILLAAVLILKLNYEENLLEKHFKNYYSYKKKTSRLIPLVY